VDLPPIDKDFLGSIDPKDDSILPDITYSDNDESICDCDLSVERSAQNKHFDLMSDCDWWLDCENASDVWRNESRWLDDLIILSRWATLFAHVCPMNFFPDWAEINAPDQSGSDRDIDQVGQTVSDSRNVASHHCEFCFCEFFLDEPDTEISIRSLDWNVRDWFDDLRAEFLVKLKNVPNRTA
jgi:hypothetical protein